MKMYVRIALVLMVFSIPVVSGCASDGYSPFNSPDAQRDRADKAHEELRRETK